MKLGRHIVIVRPSYLRLIESGRKRAEARPMRSRRVRLGRVAASQIVYFKPAGGAVVLRGVVTRVRPWCGLGPRDVWGLYRRYRTAVAAERGFWEARQAARYAVLVWFADVHPVRRGPQVERQYGGGWVVL